jgi:hypothetical protein
MEWKIGWGRDLVAAKGVRGATSITYLGVGGPKAENLRQMCKPLLFRLLRFAERFRVSDVTKILVEGIRDTVQVPRSESLAAFVDELDLWGVGVPWVSHWDEAVEGGDPGQVGRVIYCMPTCTLSAISS